MNRIISSAIVAGSLLASGQSMADGLLQWQSNSLTYLNGRDFTVNPSNQQTFTFEHADGWKYGDNFLFIDKIFYNGKGDATNGDNTYYGEISPRLSLGKILGQKIEFGPISDVLLAATYEFGEGDNESYLIGPGFDLNIPGFDYFQLNFYKRYTDGHRAGYGAPYPRTDAFPQEEPAHQRNGCRNGSHDHTGRNRAGHADAKQHANGKQEIAQKGFQEQQSAGLPVHGDFACRLFQPVQHGRAPDAEAQPGQQKDGEGDDEGFGKRHIAANERHAECQAGVGHESVH